MESELRLCTHIPLHLHPLGICISSLCQFQWAHAMVALLPTVPHPSACQVGKKLEVAPAGTVLWVCQAQLLPSAGTAMAEQKEGQLNAPCQPLISSFHRLRMSPAFSPNWFKFSESKVIKGSWQIGTNANRGSKRSLISLGHQAKEKPHRKHDNSMRKRDFVICRMAAFHCFAIWNLIWNLTTSQKINKGF